MQDVYKTIEKDNIGKKRKLFIGGRKLNISIVFITQLCLKCQKKSD